MGELPLVHTSSTSP